jgi:site-specific DNA-cytosine methylase
MPAFSPSIRGESENGGSHISLFAGVAMTDIAAEAAGFKTIATAEADTWNRKVLTRRFPKAVHFADVRDVRATASALHRVGARDGRTRRGPLLVSGGFPCQPVSLSGHGLVEKDPRWLWPEFERVVREFQPEYVLAENVAALRGRGLYRVVCDLVGLGYNVKWDCIPAAAVGAPHMRDRMFIAAVRHDCASGFHRGPHPQLPDLVGDATPRGIVATNRTGPVTYVAKLPRAGCAFADTSGVYALKPIATQREVKKALKDGEMLLPSPAKSEPGWRNITVLDRSGAAPTHPNQRFYDAGTGRVVQKGVAQIATMFPHLKPASIPMLPTPRRSANEWRTTKNAPTHGAGHGKTLAGEVNERERAAGRTPAPSSESAGNLSPRWVEWLMGLPADWTNPDVANDALRPFEGWERERRPRTEANAPHRRKRLEACGNGLVWQAAAVALDWMLP